MQNRQYVVLYGFYQNGGIAVTATRAQDCTRSGHSGRYQRGRDAQSPVSAYRLRDEFQQIASL